MASHILLIDDDPFVIDVAYESCAGLPVTLVSARGGEDGLAQLHDLIDLRVPIAAVLLDVSMPGMPGLDALGEIRENPKTRAIPVVMLTEHMSDTFLAGSYEAQANAYVVKPHERAALVRALRRTVDFWATLNVRVDSPEVGPIPPSPRPGPIPKWRN